MKFLERAITSYFPGWAAARAQARVRLGQIELAQQLHDNMRAQFGQSSSGGAGAYSGASNKRSLVSWGTSSGDADADLLPALPVLRDRAQDLYRNSPAARAAIKRKVTGAVGSGLTLRSTIDFELLGMTEEAALEWENKAEREFKLWGDSRECDYSRQLAFNEIQKLAFTSQKVRGDCFIIMSWVPRKDVPYDLRLQLIEADRVSNPNHQPDDDKIAGGIERDTNGIPVAIHVQKNHPGSRYPNVIQEWTRVPIYGTKTGRRQVLHLMEFERIDQSRGEPSLAPVIDTLKQLTRYSEAELSAAVINALLTVFVKRPAEGMNPATGVEVTYSEEEKQRWQQQLMRLGAGSWIEGEPGTDIEIISANRPGPQFDPFFCACLRQIGMALEVPYEVLSLVFQSSYSASRAALLEFGKSMKVVRAWLRNNLCQMVYEEFLTEAVVKGRLHAPGFLSDPIIRAAYCQSEWMGPSVGQIDPVKEVTAAIMKCVAGFSTWGKETAELSGADFEQTTQTRRKEIRLLKRMGLLFESIFKMAGETLVETDEEEDAKNAA